MDVLHQYSDDYILFVECGFIAVNQADEDSAKKLFKAAILLQPDNFLPLVGLGYLHLHKLELGDSISYFEKALKKDPNNEMAKTLLGIATSMTIDKVHKGEKMLVETQNSTEKEIKKLSTTALDFIDKFIKKEPSPVQGKRK
ncbi:MAG: hypothetical protein JW769_01165 [Parachlamydiales bacterium]|nr:hypothetical protein [Parachlamydiales bacterium]